MGLLDKTSLLPLRIRLTFVLVLLVAGVATVVGVISYRLLASSIEKDTVQSLDSTTKALSVATGRALEFKHDRARSELNSIELGCGISGVMAPPCAREMLRKFILAEHARGAIVSFGKGGKVVTGDANPSLDEGDVGFRVDDSGAPLFRVHVKDEESGLQLQGDFSLEDIATRETSALFKSGIVVGSGADFERVVPFGAELKGHEFILESGLMRGCFQGLASSATLVDAGNEKHYVSLKPIANAPGACTLAVVPQAQVLAPALRWRSKLKTVVLFAALSGLLVAYVLALFLTRPLTRLQKRVVRFRHGDFDSPIPQVGSGEILELSHALAEMADSINSSRAALVDSENRLRLAYRAARLWMWEQNLATGTIQWRSPEADAHVEHSTFRSLLRSVHAEDRRFLCNAVRGAKRTGTYEAEYRVLEANGEPKWISSWGQVVESRRGKPRMMVGVSLDASARKQSEALLIEQQKLTATAEMSSTLAHEINNPLTSVIGAIYMARSTPEVPEPAQKFLGIAQDEARRVAQIGRQLLSLYRAPGTAEVLDLKILWQDVLAGRAKEIQRKQLSVEHRLESARIFGFRDELRHAFAALLLNAVESAPPGGTISVRLRNSRSFSRSGERGARVLIADNGPGIAGDKLAAVFEPFVGTKNVAGSGLGLWATRAAVLKHGGNVRLRTITTGHTGTLVSLYLPARCVNN